MAQTPAAIRDRLDRGTIHRSRRGTRFEDSFFFSPVSKRYPRIEWSKVVKKKKEEKENKKKKKTP